MGRNKAHIDVGIPQKHWVFLSSWDTFSVKAITRYDGGETNVIQEELFFVGSVDSQRWPISLPG